MSRTKRPAKHASSAKGRPPATPTGLAHYAPAVIAGLFAYFLVGALPLQGGVIVRAIAAGAVIGAAIRTPGDRTILSAGAGAVGLLSAIIVASWISGVTGFVTPGLDIVAAPVVAAGVALACGEVRMRASAAWAIGLALALLGGVFLYTVGIIPGPQLDNTTALRAKLAVEPAAEGYSFDAHVFIKASFLVDQGVPYYDAFLTAFDQDSRLVGPPPGLLNIRQPWIYYVWKVLPGASGTKIWDWFILLTLATAGTAFLGLRELVDDSAALTAAAAVLGYMSFAAVTYWFPLSEYWAGCLALCAVMAMLRRKPYLAAALVTAAFSFRELAAWLIPVYVVWWFFSGKRAKWWPGLVIAVAGPVALFAAHAALSPVKQQASGSVGFWMQSTLETFLAAVRFSGGLIPGARILFPIIALMAIAGTYFVSDRSLRWPALAGALAPLALLAFFSNGQWGDYWGAIGMPTVLALGMLSFGIFAPRRT